MQPSRTQGAVQAPPVQQWHGPGGHAIADFYRLASVYVIRFSGLADFHIAHDGSTIEGYPVPGVSAETVSHLYLNQALPLALSRQRRLVLHGSAVEIDGTAVAFIARSGSGKSTLAASFAVSGHPFLSDDTLLIESDAQGLLRVEPSHPSIRLWDDARATLLPQAETAPQVDHTPKARLLAGDGVPFCSAARPLSRIYVLNPGGADDLVRIAPLSRRDALVHAASNCFLLDVHEKAGLREHHCRLVALIAQVPVHTLSYPRRFEALPAVHKAVLSHCS